MDYTEFNRRAWDAIATSNQRWFHPASPEQIDEARYGSPGIRLTATKKVPRDWFGDLQGKRLLCLAGGGGYQGPILAAAGADVTVSDISAEQLTIDQQVAEAAGLKLRTVQCDMQDLGDIGEFDLVVNPCSVNFCQDVRRVWQECFRVLKPGGKLMTGVINPINYLFDPAAMLGGKFVVQNSIPYRPDGSEDTPQEDSKGPSVPAEFGHTLEDLIGGQIAAGFQITQFFEDRWGADDLLSGRIAVFAATLALKPE